MGRSFVIWRTFLLTCICWLLVGSPLLLFAQRNGLTATYQGLDPSRNITQYLIRSWTGDNGLPSNTLNSVLQTRDGFIWVATFNSLARFDGVRFTIFNDRNTPAFNTSSFRYLYETADSTLWIQSEQGLSTYKHGKFKTYDLRKDEAADIERLFFIRGKVWVSLKSGGIFAFDRGKIQRYRRLQLPIAEDEKVNQLLLHQDSVRWIATKENGVIRIEGTQVSYFGKQEGLPSHEALSMLLATDGSFWVGTTEGLCVLENEKMQLIERTARAGVYQLIEDGHGSIWAATTNGLFRLRKVSRVPELLNSTNGLYHSHVRDVMCDREGNIWLATYRAGLNQLRDGKFVNFTTKDGLSSNTVNAICRYHQGGHLVALDAGELNYIDSTGIAKAFPLKTRLEKTRFKHVFEDRDRQLWVCTYSGLLMVSPNGQERLFDRRVGFPDDYIRTMIQDSQGMLWIGTRNAGVIKMSPQGQVLGVYNIAAGLGSNYIMSLAEDRQGNICVGTLEAGLSLISPQGRITNYSTREGLPSNIIFSIYPDVDTYAGGDVLWLTTNAGMVRFKKGNVFIFDRRNGLPSESVFDIIEDRKQTFWIPSADGIFTISKDILNKVADGHLGKADARLYNKNDGMSQEECTSAVRSFADSTQGSIWVPTLGGIVVVRPDYLPINQAAPPVEVSRITIDGTPLDLNAPVVIPPDHLRVSLHFSALSFVAPDNVQIRYKLEGFDEDWIEAEEDRQAVYTNLTDGQYRFVVIASNNDGIWNTRGITIPITVRPFFWQTWWFVLSMITLLAGIIWLIIRWRIRRVEQRNEELERMVSARTFEISRQKEELEVQKNELQAAYQDMHVVSEIGKDVTASLTLQRIVETVYESLNELMDVAVFGIGAYDPGQNAIQFTGIDRSTGQVTLGSDYLSDTDSFSVWCFNQQQDILIGDLENEYSRYGVRRDRLKVEADIRSLVYLPLAVKGKRNGVLSVKSIRQAAFSAQDITILRAMGSYVSIALDNTAAYDIIKNKNSQITDSLRYALTIQQAVLPSAARMNQAIHEYFILFRPKDIVSGDFYWFSQVNYKIFVAVVDCTGHGVPGAFMSLIGTSLLNDIVNVEDIHEPAQILEKLHLYLRTALKQEEAKNTDGMDVVLCCIEPYEEDKTQVTFAGAKRPLHYVSNQQLFELKGSKKAIGGILSDRENRHFEQHQIILRHGDTLYLSTDGLTDQHNPGGQRFGSLRLQDFIRKHHQEPLHEQKHLLLTELEIFQQGTQQRDDMTVLALRL